jgi:muramoyltetrapeptide carboxypeptidase LdcA involved in peptidoglycan recycling
MMSAMKKLIKPLKLQAGDTVATISISGGRAGDPDMIDRYLVGKARLHDIFGLEVVETPHSLKGSEYLYRNPKSRAEDLMQALLDPTIKGIVSNHGGDDGARLLPYVDFDVIRRNPKVFIGFSDISTIHNMFTHAGVSSFYGASLLSPIAQLGALDAYTIEWMKIVLFSDQTIGKVAPCDSWTPISWKKEGEADIVWTKNSGYEVLQGRGKARGRLLGGCCGPMQQIMGTRLFPAPEQWRDALIFLEIGFPYDSPLAGLHMARAFAATGMFRQARGMICANMSDEEKQVLLKVLRDEEGLADLPILVNVDFGHRTPMTVIPIGAMAEIDCDSRSFSILESGVR